MLSSAVNPNGDRSRYYTRHKERRRSTRMRKPFVIRFQLKELKAHSNARPRWNMVTAQNLSADGVTFKLNKALAQNLVFDLKIDFPGSLHPIECVGRVSRTEPLPHSRLHLISVVFTAISQHDKETIKKVAAQYQEHMKNDS